MSLRAVHLAFITAATVLAFGFGAWAFFSASASATAHVKLWGAASFAFGAALIAYGAWFIQKLRRQAQ